MRSIRQRAGQTAGGLPRPFWYVWGATLINRVGSFVLIFLAIYLTQVRGFSVTYAGLVIGLWGAGGAVGTLVGGVLADRWGRKPTFITALYLSAALMMTLGLARGQLEIALAVVALGVVSEASRPAMSALLVDIVPERDRMRAFSLNYWAINLGFSIAATVAGLVAGVDYLLLFVVDAASTAATATLIAVKVREPARHRVPTTRPGTHPAPGLGRVFRDRVFLGFVACNLLTALVFLQHISTLPMSMSADGLPPGMFGTVIALNGIMIVAGQLFVPRLIANWGRAATLATATVVIGLGFGLTAFADTAWLYATTVIIWTLGEMLHAPSNSASIAELSPADMRGRYQGVFSLSWSAASFLAPTLGSQVQQHLGASALWLGCAGIAGVVAVWTVLSGPARLRRAAQLRGAPEPALAAQSPSQPELAPAVS